MSKWLFGILILFSAGSVQAGPKFDSMKKSFENAKDIQIEDVDGLRTGTCAWEKDKQVIDPDTMVAWNSYEDVQDTVFYASKENNVFFTYRHPRLPKNLNTSNASVRSELEGMIANGPSYYRTATVQGGVLTVEDADGTYEMKVRKNRSSILLMSFGSDPMACRFTRKISL